MTAAEKIRSKAKRTLGPMAAFSGDVAPGHGLERVLGLYQATSAAKRIWVTEEGLVVEFSGARRTVRYSDIRDVRAPSSKDKQQRGNRMVTAILVDGRTEVFEIAGGEGRFCDAFEFARFLAQAVSFVSIRGRG